MPRQVSPEIGQYRQFTEHNLVFMMGEELKKPLTAIKLLAENNANLSTISLEARRALRTVDNILLYQQLSTDQVALQFEPVHLGSAITQVAHDLSPLSIEFGCETEVFIQPGMTTVDVDSTVLRSGIESLWQAVLGMAERPSPLTWHVNRTQKGIRIAVVNNSMDLKKVSLSIPKSTTGQSRQPFAGIAGPATDLMTAKGLFMLIGSPLTKITKDGSSGFAVTFRPSAQLALV
jgi:light-regulated signal transduction histidine kinase (bacteriophytochrome)